ncbi:penicillin-binding protein transpeptidase [Clostridium sp. CAG:567]|jgi:stage V sporulation protein D (sporulation-specific penicillin-binding protein)|nr:penicillin-binding protein transpeptidase [Clostridium sp. CAG:567]
MKKALTMSKKIRIAALIVLILMLLLVFRIAFIQFIQGSDLKQQMYNQLITNRTISPKRGTIYDSTGKALAISADVDTISIVPSSIVVYDKANDKIDEEKTKNIKESLSKALSEIFELNYDETLEKVSSDSNYITIARKVEKDKVDKLKEWMKKEEFYSGINISEDTKRYYPYNNLASSLIGFCGTDNDGLEGLEKAWDDVLTGTPGKVTTAQDAIQEFIPDNNQTYIPAENGSDITLTIDANIQSIVEKYLKQACIDNKCTRGGNVIAMDPKTGDILAMATYPDYNLNTPFEMPASVTEKTWKSMTSEEQYNTIYELFRNRAISDTYEPGSVFKVITASIALEENLAIPDKADVYYCKGYQTVYGTTINCAYRIKHGHESLREAFAVSCNPAFIQISEKIGATTSYKYYNAYGFFEKTGINTVGEADSIFWKLNDVGPIELATMSFGQRFKITPIQMATAVCAVANNGVLIKPRIVKEIKNTDTGAITTINTAAVRQVISKTTAETMMDLLETVVTDGSGKYAKIKGYSIAGKTGTSEPDYNKNEGYTASFVAISPTENPELVLLVTLYDPQGPKGYSGNTVAAPVAAQMLKEILPYMQISTDNSESTSTTKTITLPNVTNKTVAEAEKLLKNAGFTVSTSASSTDIVTEQYPTKGYELVKGSIVKLYTETENTRVSKQVPDLTGKSLYQVKTLLKELNLNYSVTGSGTVVSQEPIANTSVEEGTIIKVTLGK